MIKKVTSVKLKSYLKTIILTDLLDIEVNSKKSVEVSIIDSLTVDKFNGATPIVVKGHKFKSNLKHMGRVYLKKSTLTEIHNALSDLLTIDPDISKINNTKKLYLVNGVIAILNEIAVCGKSPIQLSLSIEDYKDLRNRINNKSARRYRK